MHFGQLKTTLSVLQCSIKVCNEYSMYRLWFELRHSPRVPSPLVVTEGDTVVKLRLTLLSPTSRVVSTLCHKGLTYRFQFLTFGHSGAQP